MKSKKELLKKSCLYVIIDKKVLGYRDIFNTATKIKNYGADIIQFRDKESKRDSVIRDALLLHKLLLNNKAIFIINDYLDVAKIVDSDGVHLGQDDTSIEIARRVLGPDKIIGVSCHNLRQALKAQKTGADYIGIGPIFSTLTKPKNTKTMGLDLIKELKQKIKIPFFAIGGINQYNITTLISSGAERVAICRAILQAKNISGVTKYFSKILH